MAELWPAGQRSVAGGADHARRFSGGLPDEGRAVEVGLAEDEWRWSGPRAELVGPACH